ncbi:hypothetical protein BV25DRAFT_1814257 [Artomyces pyxidatus]|uniref:Uncharacterized protein n=1 Tax=Artomyces pyxidatus TaxID=48021 RepID=A0ACB8SJN0_9AGAM|nr:hypothetical protein BV25DRAFT_1814257 [Artomyces pyxidatus]
MVQLTREHVAHLQLEDKPGPSGTHSTDTSTLEESTGLLDDFDRLDTLAPPGDHQGPPPDFTPYEAEYWVSEDKSVISHDPHLNEDGEALYRFLLSQADSPPTYSVHCRGTHTEQRTRRVKKSHADGKRRTKTEQYTETVTDFDFAIDLSELVPAAATQWTVGDGTPAYRGRMHREVGAPGDTRKASAGEVKDYERWRGERQVRGLPPWVGEVRAHPGDAGAQTHGVLQSSWTLRQWADDYCASPKVFKEFVYHKARVIYGWHVESLQTAIRSAIYSTPYTGSLSVTFRTNSTRVTIRPNTLLARMLSNPWLGALVYPLIWLFQNFHPLGGGRWTVAGGAYALKRFEPVNRVVETESGPRLLVGVREGEWFKRWEGMIRRMVVARKVDPTPVSIPDDAAGVLDGYA